jgi:hypothetical protein
MNSVHRRGGEGEALENPPKMYRQKISYFVNPGKPHHDELSLVETPRTEND